MVSWFDGAPENAAILNAKACIKVSSEYVKVRRRMILRIDVEAEAVDAANQLLDEVEAAVCPDTKPLLNKHSSAGNASSTPAASAISRSSSSGSRRTAV
jgi:hypothetical protein